MPSASTQGICHALMEVNRKDAPYPNNQSHWIVEAIRAAYESAGEISLSVLRAHSTQAMTMSWAFKRSTVCR